MFVNLTPTLATLDLSSFLSEQVSDVFLSEQVSDVILSEKNWIISVTVKFIHYSGDSFNGTPNQYSKLDPSPFEAELIRMESCP